MFDRPDKYRDRECLIYLIIFYPYIKLLSYELVKSNAWNDKTMSVIYIRHFRFRGVLGVPTTPSGKLKKKYLQTV